MASTICCAVGAIEWVLYTQRVSVRRGAQTKQLDEIGGTDVASEIPRLPATALVALYQAADVFVFPSLIETFGIVIVEAMAAGLPIIVSDAPGCRDVVRHGEDGMMVPARDADALAMSILFLLTFLA